MICVISQPTFLPWLGWFDLADQADVMILLDDVQFSKQSWQQRNRIRTRNGLEFLTVPVKTSGRFGQLIMDCELSDRRSIIKMIKTIRTSYAKALFFSSVIDDLESVMVAATDSGLLVDLNIALITWMAGHLGVSTPMLRASTLDVCGRRGDYMAAICEHIGADHYLSPAGSKNYLIEDKSSFDQRNITVWLHVYEHPEYKQQFSPFMPFASALDLIFNAGPAAPKILRSGRRSAQPLVELLK